MGLELQLEELIEQRARAIVQERTEDAKRLEVEVSAVQAELAATAERVAQDDPRPEPGPKLHNAEELGVDESPD